MPYTYSSNTPYKGITNVAPSGTSPSYVMVTGLALPASTSRNTAYLQVIGSGTPLYVCYGAPAGTGSMSQLLKAASSDFGTDGGILVENGFLGDIYVSGSNRFLCWQNV